MKKSIFTALVAVLSCLVAWAQAPPNNIMITGNFEPECLYEIKLDAGNEYPDELVACKNSTVTYTARSGISAPGWQWSVLGAVSHTATGNRVTVRWGGDDWGNLTVVQTDAVGNTHTATRRVRLVDVPVVGAATVPAYTVNAYGEKVIRVCRGDDIQFIDRSIGGDSDIAGWLWTTSVGDQYTSASFTLEQVQEGMEVRHRVFNNCGCQSEETYLIEVEEGIRLELDCYGTVCEDSRVTYRTLEPECHDYMWYVEGGTLVSGQGTPTPTVVWDRPTDGYGVLGLDGTLCGDMVCPMLMSRKVPIVHGGLAIAGPTDLCAGESAEYSLPLLGSTRYEWSVSPSAGVDVSLVNQSHQVRLMFNAPGTYTLEVAYRCDFLDCGYYQSQPLTVRVKPALEIEGESEVCETNACTLSVSPAVAATWRVYDDAGVQVGPAATGSTFVRTFPGAGRYVVEAEHPDYCRTAMHAMTVRAAPPAPTLADLDPDNRHVACPGQGLVLRGMPASPAYSLMWDPVAASASPHDYTGNEVTISYGAEVGDVRVYHYDRTLQCRSSNYLVHTVAPLTLLPITINRNITVCPGTVITWGDNDVPDQSADGVLYEWKIQHNKQHCASVQGSHLENRATLTVHKLTAGRDEFNVVLTRTLCGGQEDFVIRVNIENSMSESIALSCPGPLCEDDEATLTASGGNSDTYRWYIDGNAYTGSPVTHTFDHSGDIPVTLRSNPYTYCSNEEYYSVAICTVRVNPRPPLQFAYYDRTTGLLTTEPQFGEGYTVAWQWMNQSGSGYWLYGGTGSSVVPSGDGTYRCTVTNVATGCTATAECGYSSPPCPSIAAIPLTHTVNYCNGTVSLSAGSTMPGATLSWSVRGRERIVLGPGRTATFAAPRAGSYLVEVRADLLPCHLGQKIVTVDFVPDFEVVAECNKIVILNRSTYLGSGSTPVYMSVDGVTVSFPVSQERYTCPAAAAITHTVALQGFGTHSFAPCPENTFTVETVSPLTSVSIATANTAYPNQTCDNTPILLTATTTPARSVAFAEWTFGDHSSFGQAGASISHTFGSQNYDYYMSVHVTDNYGCEKHSGTYPIRSNPDVLAGGRLMPIDPITCPGAVARVNFSAHSVINQYTWTHPDGFSQPGPNPYPTYYSGRYDMYVINDHYCQKEATRFVPFLNPPVADIYVESTTGCVGQSMRLSGDNGPDAAVTYVWDIIGPGTFYETHSTPTVTFTPPVPGTYTVNLYVTDGTCSATDVETLTVNARPAAPTLSFSGSPCISDAPVRVGATGFSGEMHWSNGNTGPTARCYYPGPLEGWYVDPLLGCPSEKAQLLIERQPDLDALLTGCYTQCEMFFPNSLPVYGLTTVSQSVDWEWLRDGNVEASGNGNYFNNTISLPLNAPGIYSLSVDYANGNCNVSSPQLTLAVRDTCPCDEVEVEVVRTLHIKDCILSWEISAVVRNNSTSVICINDLVPLFDPDREILINYMHIHDNLIPPGGEGYIDLVLTPLTMEPSVALFETPLKCECSLQLAFDLTPEVDCEAQITDFGWMPVDGLSTPSVMYYTFGFSSLAQQILSVQGTPPMVIDWSYAGNNVNGLGMIDVALLTQLADAAGQVCIEALVCESDQLCRYRTCLDASELWAQLLDMGFGGDPGEPHQFALPRPRNAEPTLAPNPTTGEVRIETSDRVTDVLVMDMNGREMASFENTSSFNISGLPSGAYIVRVKTRQSSSLPEKTSYHKIVKK